MINKRQANIISILIKAGKPMSNRELSRIVDVSARTVSNDISVINQEVSLSGHTIETGGSGHFIPEDQVSYFYGLLNAPESESDAEFPDTPSRRMYYILFQFLFLDDYVTMEQLADAMFFSKTTISYDIRNIEQFLEPMKVSLKITPKGMYLDGTEEEKRELLENIFMSAYKQNSFQFVRGLLSRMGILDQEKLMHLYQLLIDCFAEAGMSLTDRGIQIFTLMNAADYFRIAQGYTVPGLSGTEISPVFDYDRIEELYDIQLNDDERRYMSVLLFRRRVTHYGKEPAQDEVIHEIITEFYDVLQNQYGIDAGLLNTGREGLTSHLSALIQRARNSTVGDREVTERIRRNYPYAFECATSILPIIQKHMGLVISEEEVAYIAVYIAMILDAVSEKQDVIILCGSGMGLAQLIRTRVENNFGTKLNVKGTYSVYQLNQALRIHPDTKLIITTVPVPRSCTVPSVLVSPLFEKEDIDKLSQFLNSHRIDAADKEQGKTVRDLFRQDLFEIRKGPVGKKQLIAELAARLKEAGIIEDAQQFLLSVWEREEVHSTLYDGIWLPHPMKSMSDRSVFSVCICPDNTDFGIVFLMALRSEDINRYRIFYDKLIRIMDDKNLFRKIQKTKSFEEFMETMEKL